MTKPKAKAMKKSIGRIRPTMAWLTELKTQVVDLTTERDALAARLLELENGPIVLAPSADVPSLTPGVLLPVSDTFASRRIEALEAFLRQAMASATFNSTEAGKLLNPVVDPEQTPG